MKEQGLTQARLAKLANISQASLSAIVNGSNPKADTLASLASALNVSESELQRRSDVSLDVCPRCGSRSLIIWQNTADGSVRVHCSFCELDSGEQKSMEKVCAVLSSFSVHRSSAESPSARVLALSEVLDSSAFGADFVRPVWFENRGLFVVPSLLQCGTAERENELCRVQWLGENGTRSFLWEKYGLFWRVWSAKPSEGMIEAMQWED